MASLWSSLGEEKDGGGQILAGPQHPPQCLLSAVFSKCHGPTTIWDPFFVGGKHYILSTC